MAESRKDDVNEISNDSVRADSSYHMTLGIVEGAQTASDYNRLHDETWQGPNNYII